MIEKQHPEFRLDSFSLVNLVLRYWKVLMITGILAFIISAIISLTITPLYRSNVTLFPASNISESAAVIFNSNASILSFGDEEATERVLQILQSDDIREYLVQKYELFDHYGIEPEERYSYTLLHGKMDKYISFRKTQFMSVDISVLDNDPEVAARMANDIAAFVDTIFNKLLQNAGVKYFEIISSQYNSQMDLVIAYEDSLLKLGNDHGIINVEEEFRAGNIARFGPEFLRFSESHGQAVENLGIIQQKQTEAKLAARQDFPYTFVINEARVQEKKAFPRRSVITIISTALTLLFVIIVLIILDGLAFRVKD